MRTCRTLSLIACALVALGSLPGCLWLFPNYSESIVRTSSNDFEAGLIAQAEAACPSADEFLQSCHEQPTPDPCQWWCQDTPFSHVPYAVTGDAVRYYSALVAKYKKEGPFLTGNPTSAEFSYEATVQYRPQYVHMGAIIPVYQVNLTLKFNVVCARNCFYGVHAMREVIFDTAGNLLEISGDQRYGYGQA